MFSIKTKPTIEKSVSSYPSYLGKELYKLLNFRNYFDHELLLQYSTHTQKTTYGETNGKQKILAGLSRTATDLLDSHLDGPSTMVLERNGVRSFRFLYKEAANCTCYEFSLCWNLLVFFQRNSS